jgi:hypothetical protein
MRGSDRCLGARCARRLILLLVNVWAWAVCGPAGLSCDTNEAEMWIAAPMGVKEMLRRCRALRVSNVKNAQPSQTMTQGRSNSRFALKR